MHGAPSDSPPYVRALLFTFRLGQACMGSKEELPSLAEKKKVLSFEENVHLQFLQTAECHQEVHAVLAKPADRLCVDKADLPLLTIGHHLLEPWAGIDDATCNPLPNSLNRTLERISFIDSSDVSQPFPIKYY